MRILVASTDGTVTVQVAVSPLDVFTVIVAVPGATAVTTPVFDTVTIFL